jgi:hypothetical protein
MGHPMYRLHLVYGPPATRCFGGIDVWATRPSSSMLTPKVASVRMMNSKTQGHSSAITVTRPVRS